MLYKFKDKDIHTNLAGDSFNKLQKGDWKLGLFSSNERLSDISGDFYEDSTLPGDENKTHRTLKNKTSLVLIDGSCVYKHIIHWNPSKDYFCVTTNDHGFL